MTLSRRSVAIVAALVTWFVVTHWLDSFGAASADLSLLMAAASLGSIILVLPARVTKTTRIVALLIAGTGIIIIQHMLPVLFGPDARAYFNQASYQNTGTLWDALRESFGLRIGAFTPTRTSFPLLVKGLLGPLVDIGPWTIAFSNLFLWALASLYWVDTVHRRYGIDAHIERHSVNVMFLIFMLSPSALYWVSVYDKDLTVTALTMLAAIALFNKYYIRAFAIVVLTSLIRPYAAPLILILLMFLIGNGKYIKHALVIVAVVFAIYSRALLVNWVTIYGYTFLSPDPLHSSSWLPYIDDGTWTLSPLLFMAESLAVCTVLVIGAWLIATHYRQNRVLFLAIGCIALLAAVNALEGYLLQTLQSNTYGVGEFGDNMLRKKFVSWPLVMTFTGLVVSRLTYGSTRTKCLHRTLVRTRQTQGRGA